MKTKLFCMVSLAMAALSFGQKANQHLWDNEPKLSEVAQACTISQKLSKMNPQPFGMGESENTPNLSNPKMKISLWGPTNQLTLSVNKNDVWDRRKAWEKPVTLKEIEKTYFSSKNKDNAYPEDYLSSFYMNESGKWVDPYAAWRIYPFPCAKPVGQVILFNADFEKMAQPTAYTSCQNGLTELSLQKDQATAKIKYLVMMDENIIAIQGDYKNITKEVKLRLYRHKDIYDPKTLVIKKNFSDYNVQKDSVWNRPLDMPESGTDGEFFWIRQKLPAEKTFPKGFEYFFVGLVTDAKSQISVIEGQKNLGTQFFYNNPTMDAQKIGEAKGAAATASFENKTNLEFTAYITVATSNDAADPLSFAKQRLKEAQGKGFETLVKQNEKWYTNLYNKRENGRIYTGNVKDIKRVLPGIYYSWINDHMMSSPDPTRYEADSHGYSLLECDNPRWHGLPCYNELYNSPYIATFNRCDQLDYYVKLIDMWHLAAKANALETFGLPGMFMTHGYLPPIKADVYPHSHVNYEFAMEMPAQTLKYLWDKWDYGGDTDFLKEKVYPVIKDLAVFYAAYVKKESDGLFHIVPTLPQERWVLGYQFKYNRDALPAITLIRWTFNRAAEAAKLLNVDADLSSEWLSISGKLPAFPILTTKTGPVWLPVKDDPCKPDAPIGCTGKHSGVFNPVNIAGEVNLDSNPYDIQTAIRSANFLSDKHWSKNMIYHLLGDAKNKLYTYMGMSDRWHFKTLMDGMNWSHKSTILNTHESLVDAAWIEPERLLNSRSGRIHLFPCVVDNFTIGFKNMLTRGGFEVSAELNKGKVTFIKVKPHRDNTCHIVNPWSTKNITVCCVTDNVTVNFSFDDFTSSGIVFDTKAGKSYIVKLSN